MNFLWVVQCTGLVPLATTQARFPCLPLSGIGEGDGWFHILRMRWLWFGVMVRISINLHLLLLLLLLQKEIPWWLGPDLINISAPTLNHQISWWFRVMWHTIWCQSCYFCITFWWNCEGLCLCSNATASILTHTFRNKLWIKHNSYFLRHRIINEIIAQFQIDINDHKN